MSLIESEPSFPKPDGVDPRDWDYKNRFVAEVVLRTVEVEERDQKDRIYLNSRIVRDIYKAHPELPYQQVNQICCVFLKGNYLEINDEYHTDLTADGRQLLSDLRDQFRGQRAE